MAVEKYGRNRMNVEVSKLRSQLREVEEKCVDVSFFLTVTFLDVKRIFLTIKFIV